jgi:hypothetical protein
VRSGAGAAFLLAIDRCEELFNFAEAAERRRFDRLLARAGGSRLPAFSPPAQKVIIQGSPST